MNRRILFYAVSPVISFQSFVISDNKKPKEVAKKAHAPFLMLADLDGTLVGCNEGFTCWLDHWLEEEATKQSTLCYNTARCITDYEKLVKTSASKGEFLPTPDVLITGEGTEIRWCVDKAKSLFKLDQIWDRRMKEHWRDSGLEQKVKELLLPYNQDLQPRDLNALENSPPYGEYRVAITVQGKEKAIALTKELQCKLGNKVTIYTFTGWGPEDFELICALPNIALKGNAALYVQDALGFSHNCCIAAGDTKGDSSMLDTGFPFICVGNSSDDLLVDVNKVSRPDLHYMAEGKHGHGVVEGLRFFRDRHHLNDHHKHTEEPEDVIKRELHTFAK
mmetsp:Transcript_4921/g.6371  ORF Transcript_4921/g.6371 Transcript_4921/m.6371 type:complete len:334 (+) Transcript_4921:114-1115(+)